MRWPPPRSVALGFVGLVGLVSLLAFQATGRAEASHASPLVDAAAEARPVYGPVWTPEIVTAPGLPVQCSDGTWTRTVVRGGCARHGGITH